MKTKGYYQVTRERIAQPRIYEEIHIREFYNQYSAEDYFTDVCNDLCYPWFNIMENNKHYQIIAQAGGTGCDYRITLTYHYNG
jgi:hypothetical protein